MIFAIGDIHGCADELRLLLNRLPRTSSTTVVFLGDYIDRGSRSREVIDTVLELRQQCNVVALMGNHEAMFLDYLRAPQSARAGAFIYNGGSATLASYANEHAEVIVPDSHLEFLRSLLLIYQTAHNVFVHAGLPDMPLAEIDLASHKSTMLWTRGRFLTSNYDWGKVVVHGHSPVPRVTVRPNRINIDTGCVFNGRLTAIGLPGETCFNVKKMKSPQQIVLRDASGTREAHRFTGTIPVRVHHAGRVHELVTVDYSELGMYLRAVDPDENRRFNEGERIEGVVAPDDLSPVAFTGIIVRRRIDDLGVHYGVKLIESNPVTPSSAAFSDIPTDS